MKHEVEVQMVTGTMHKSKAIEVGSDFLKILYNLDDASYIQLPITDAQIVILNPAHIVSVTLHEVVE